MDGKPRERELQPHTHTFSEFHAYPRPFLHAIVETSIPSSYYYDTGLALTQWGTLTKTKGMSLFNDYE